MPRKLRDDETKNAERADNGSMIHNQHGHPYAAAATDPDGTPAAEVFALKDDQDDIETGDVYDHVSEGLFEPADAIEAGPQGGEVYDVEADGGMDSDESSRQARIEALEKAREVLQGHTVTPAGAFARGAMAPLPEFVTALQALAQYILTGQVHTLTHTEVRYN